MTRPLAVYCVAAVLFAQAAWSLFVKFGVLWDPDAAWAWKVFLVGPALLGAGVGVGLLMLRKWAWIVGTTWSLLNGIAGLVVWLGLEPALANLLNTPSRVAWWGIYVVMDFVVVVVLLLKPVRDRFFYRARPTTALPTGASN